MVPIESDGHVRRARRTAAWARAAIGVTGIALLLVKPHLLEHPLLGLVGFATITLTAAVHLYGRRLSWLRLEESLAAIAAILIVGLGNQSVTVLSVLWLAAVASGVMARGGRVHWIGRTVVLVALALPVLREGRLTLEHAGPDRRLGRSPADDRTTYRRAQPAALAGALGRRPRRADRPALALRVSSTTRLRERCERSRARRSRC